MTGNDDRHVGAFGLWPRRDIWFFEEVAPCRTRTRCVWVLWNLLECAERKPWITNTDFSQSDSVDRNVAIAMRHGDLALHHARSADHPTRIQLVGTFANSSLFLPTDFLRKAVEVGEKARQCGRLDVSHHVDEPLVSFPKLRCMRLTIVTERRRLRDELRAA